jgi:hypothetical protein
LTRIKGARREWGFNGINDSKPFHVHFMEARMQALKELLTTDVGLLSAAVLLFMLAMGVFFVRFFVRHARRGD